MPEVRYFRGSQRRSKTQEILVPVKVEFPANPNRKERRKALADLRKSGRRIEKALLRLKKKAGGAVAPPTNPKPTEGPTEVVDGAAAWRFDAAVDLVLKKTAQAEQDEPALE